MKASSESNGAHAREAGQLVVPAAATGPTPTSPNVIVERPSSPLARGNVPFPAWGIALIGASVVAIGLAVLLVSLRARRLRRTRRR